MAGELGFEPRQAESESAVLPLDDSPCWAATEGSTTHHDALNRRHGPPQPVSASLILAPISTRPHSFGVQLWDNSLGTQFIKDAGEHFFGINNPMEAELAGLGRAADHIVT